MNNMSREVGGKNNTVMRLTMTTMEKTIQNKSILLEVAKRVT